jgi:DNA-binding HxlR family transcriptional regulator
LNVLKAISKGIKSFSTLWSRFNVTERTLALHLEALLEAGLIKKIEKEKPLYDLTQLGRRAIELEKSL